MSDATPDSLIPYDEIVQEALRAVVGRKAGATRVAAGLFSFAGFGRTGAP